MGNASVHACVAVKPQLHCFASQRAATTAGIAELLCRLAPGMSSEHATRSPLGANSKTNAQTVALPLGRHSVNRYSKCAVALESGFLKLKLIKESMIWSGGHIARTPARIAG